MRIAHAAPAAAVTLSPRTLRANLHAIKIAFSTETCELSAQIILQQIFFFFFLHNCGIQVKPVFVAGFQIDKL